MQLDAALNIKVLWWKSKEVKLTSPVKLFFLTGADHAACVYRDNRSFNTDCLKLYA